MALERILRHCLEKRPQDRFQSTRDLVFDLEAVAQAGTAGAPGWSPRRGRRLRLAMVAGRRAWPARGGRRRPQLVAHGIWNSRRTAPLSAVPLTSLSGWESDPALSPDGSHLAFSWTRDGDARNGDIYVQLIGAGTPLRLTTDPADDRSPAWSPDGRHIAFLRCLGSEPGVFTVPALGGPERKLQATACSPSTQEEGRSLDWSDDGKLLAFSDKTSADGFSIFLLSIETLEKRRLTFPPVEHQADLRPAFSPDGRSVAFARGGGTTEPGLFVVPVAGGEPRPLSLGDVWTGGVPSGHTWTPDGSSIVASWSRDVGDAKREPMEGPGSRRRPGAAGGRRGQRQPTLHLPPGKPPGLRADAHRHRHLGDRDIGFAAQGPLAQEGDLILAQGRRPAALPGRQQDCLRVGSVRR